MSVVSKAEFARLAGVSPAAITKVSKSVLREAMTEGGIDADHPAAIKYLNRGASVGRPQGNGKQELAEYIRSRSAELRRLEQSLTVEAPHLVKSVADNLFYLGFASDRIPTGERADRTDYVERTLDQLRTLTGGV